MTGYTVHTGSTLAFTRGWDTIFGGAQTGPKKKTATSTEGAAVGKRAAVRAKSAKKAPAAKSPRAKSPAAATQSKSGPATAKKAAARKTARRKS